MFGGLPDPVSNDIFRNLIICRDLVKLDSACCNRKLRIKLLQIFQKSYFVLQDTVVGTKVIEWFAARNVQFTKLVFNQNIPSSLFLKISTFLNTTKLTSISFINMDENEREAISLIMTNSPQLTELNFVRLNQESIEAELFYECCWYSQNQLKKLNLFIARGNHPIIHIFIYDCCVNLTHLTLNYDGLTGDTVRIMVASLACLQVVDIRNIEDIDRDTIMTFANECPDLISCVLSGTVPYYNLTHTFVHLMLRKCKKLHFFQVTDQESDEVLIKYQYNFSNLQKRIFLADLAYKESDEFFTQSGKFTIICLNSCGVYSEFDRIENEFMDLIIKNNPSLQQLELNKASGLTMEHLAHLIQNSPHLHTLKLSNNNKIKTIEQNMTVIDLLETHNNRRNGIFKRLGLDSDSVAVYIYALTSLKGAYLLSKIFWCHCRCFNIHSLVAFSKTSL